MDDLPSANPETVEAIRTLLIEREVRFHGLFGAPGVGKSFYFSDIPDAKVDIQHATGTVVRLDHFLPDFKDQVFLIDHEGDLPEWQRRAKRSRDAKAALVAKMKKRR